MNNIEERVNKLTDLQKEILAAGIEISLMADINIPKYNLIHALEVAKISIYGRPDRAEDYYGDIAIELADKIKEKTLDYVENI